MTENHTLIAFLSTLVAIVVLVLCGAWLSINHQPTEALGIGAAVTGLIGLIGTFRPRNPASENQDVTITNSSKDAVPMKEIKK